MERKVKTLTPMYNQQDDPTIMLSKQKGFTVSITILFHKGLDRSVAIIFYRAIINM